MGAGGGWGYLVVSGRPMVGCHRVRAVPLAAFIPSRVPGLGRGAWGGFASKGGQAGANQVGALPPGAGRTSLRPAAWHQRPAQQR
jgi:hypothetical protein